MEGQDYVLGWVCFIVIIHGSCWILLQHDQPSLLLSLQHCIVSCLCVTSTTCKRPGIPKALLSSVATACCTAPACPNSQHSLQDLVHRFRRRTQTVCQISATIFTNSTPAMTLHYCCTLCKDCTSWVCLQMSPQLSCLHCLSNVAGLLPCQSTMPF